MEIDPEVVGQAGPEKPYVATPESLAAYALVVGGEGPLYAALPLTDAVAPVLERLASPEARERVVHYAHDLNVYRRIAVGETVLTVARVTALARRTAGTLAVVQTTTTGGGELVNEQALTLFFRDVQAPHSVGAIDRRSIGAPPPAARVLEMRVADDLPERYAEVSGDRFPIHLDDAFARSVGLPGRIVHGMCTLALAVTAIGGEVRRLSARFAAPLLPGSTLTTTAWEDDGAVHFECHAGERRVLRDGVARVE